MSKLGVYLCSGCQIGDALDIPQLAKLAPVCRTHEALCSEAGRQLILEDLESGKVERVLVGACSSRFKTEAFTFNHGSIVDGAIVERVNLREHVAWSHKPNDEDTQMLAEDYL